MGYKGRVHYHCAPCIDYFLNNLSPEIPKTKVFDVIAEHIDEEIFRNYCLYPNNYIALDTLEGNNAHADKYTAEEKATFDKYLKGQLAKIDIPGKDDEFLMERMLTMYANPARNKIATTKE